MVNNPPANERDIRDFGLIPGSGRSPSGNGPLWPSTPVLLPGESPWTEELGGLQFMGSQKVRND